MQQLSTACNPDVLRKARKIAAEFVVQGAQAVILSGSAARGKEEPNDLDFLVLGDLRTSPKDLETILGETYGIPVQAFAFPLKYVRVLIQQYQDKTSREVLGFRFQYWAQGSENRHLSWPLIPLLPPEEFTSFFSEWLGYKEGMQHPYISPEYIILAGEKLILQLRQDLKRKPRFAGRDFLKVVRRKIRLPLLE